MLHSNSDIIIRSSPLSELANFNSWFDPSNILNAKLLNKYQAWLLNS